MKRRLPERLATWFDTDGVVHICFPWSTAAHDRELWSTVCMLHDSLTAFAVDDWGYEHPTCVACVAGSIVPDTIPVVI